MKKILTSLGILSLTTAANAAWVFNSTGTQTLNFDGNYADVIRFAPALATFNKVSIAEPASWPATGGTDRFSFISTAVTGQWPGQGAFAAPFAADANNNSSTTDVFDNAQMVPVTSPSAVLGDYALQFSSGTWADKGYIFKIDNTSGATIADWSLGLDTWFNDTGAGGATIRLGYATSFTDFTGGLGFGAGWTELDTRTSTNTNAGLSALDNIGGSFSASVANGSSLYVALLYDMDTGGNAITIDNLSLTAGAVPEPSTLAMLMGGVAWLGLLRRRPVSRS